MRYARGPKTNLLCPKCHSRTLDVVDTRTNRSANLIRRRRKCKSCGSKMTTFEIPIMGTRINVRNNVNAFFRVGKGWRAVDLKIERGNE